MYNGTRLCDKYRCSNHKIIGCLSLCSITTTLRMNVSTKIRRNLRELEKYISASTHIFPTWFVLTIVIPLIPTPQAVSMVIYTLKVNTQWNKCHYILWLALMKLDIQKLAMDMCVFSIQKLVLKNFPPIKLCFRHHGIQQHISVIFWGTGKSITDLEKQAYKYDMLLFWKIRLGYT